MTVEKLHLRGSWQRFVVTAGDDIEIVALLGSCSGVLFSAGLHLE